MARKKKTQLKPVARGFATVSVPKKTTPAEVLEGKPKEGFVTSSLKDGTVSDEHNEMEEAPTTTNATTTDIFDPEKVEAARSLQNLVDRLQEKTEKEVLRYALLVLGNPLDCCSPDSV